MSNLKSTLIAARNLIEKGWARGASARLKNGMRAHIDDDSATNFCAVGAIRRTLQSRGEPCLPPARGNAYDPVLPSVRHLAKAILGSEPDESDKTLNSFSAVILFNDKTAGSKRDVIKMFERAIEAAP